MHRDHGEIVGPPHVRAAVVAIAGTGLRPEEDDLLRRQPPAGVILFGRNCRDRAQLRALTDALRATQPGRRLPVLIDQEGGRVMRLRPARVAQPPVRRALWARSPRGRPPGGARGRAAARPADRARPRGGRASTSTARRWSTSAGPRPRAPSATAPSRPTRSSWPSSAGAFADGPAGRRGGAGAEAPAGPRAGAGRQPPGAAASSTCRVTNLIAHGLRCPPRRCTDLPLAMTAHVLYRAVDPDRPGTLSPVVIGRADPRRGRLRRPAAERRPRHGGAGGRSGEPGRARAGRRLRPRGGLHREARGEPGRRWSVRALARRRQAGAPRRRAVPPPASDGFDPEEGRPRLAELLGVPVA